MDLQRLPPPPEDDEQKEFLLDDEDFYNTVNFGPEWQEQPDIQFPHDEQMAAAYKDMVAPVKAQGASRRVIEFEESAGIGLQEDIEEIENAVAEHRLADIHEVIGAEYEIEEMTEKKKARLAREQAARDIDDNKDQDSAEIHTVDADGESVGGEEGIVVYEDDTAEESGVIEDGAEGTLVEASGQPEPTSSPFDIDKHTF